MSTRAATAEITAPQLAAEEKKRHTLKWFKENYGVNPLKLGIPFVEAPNPHYRSAAPMKLWSEAQVEPFKNQTGIEKFAKKRRSGQRAAETRRKNVKTWFVKAQERNPRIARILARLYDIHVRIGKLHDLKQGCRNLSDSGDFWEYGVPHCDRCAHWTQEQDNLRFERAQLFDELEEISGIDKRTIQLARRYLREDRNHNNQEEAKIAKD